MVNVEFAYFCLKDMFDGNSIQNQVLNKIDSYTKYN